MEQALQAILGLLLILLVSLALVSAVAIIVLIELGWIVRLAARLYWRWRSSVHPFQVGAEQPGPAGQRQDAPAPNRRHVAHSNGTPRHRGAGGAVPGSDKGSERPGDESE